MIIVAEITVYWGIKMYHVNRSLETNLPEIHLAIFLGILLLLEIWH